MHSVKICGDFLKNCQTYWPANPVYILPALVFLFLFFFCTGLKVVNPIKSLKSNTMTTSVNHDLMANML